jgi:hypothetical protein
VKPSIASAHLINRKHLRSKLALIGLSSLVLLASCGGSSEPASRIERGLYYASINEEINAYYAQEKGVDLKTLAIPSTCKARLVQLGQHIRSQVELRGLPVVGMRCLYLIDGINATRDSSCFAEYEVRVKVATNTPAPSDSGIIPINVSLYSLGSSGNFPLVDPKLALSVYPTGSEKIPPQLPFDSTAFPALSNASIDCSGP